jgi:predicted aspartyl protease
MLRMFCLMAALLMPHVGASAAVSAPEAVTLFAAPTQMDQVGRILAPVMINGRGPFNLLVDTGANSTTFSTRLVDQLGIDYRGNVMLNGVTGRALVPVVSVDRLEAGALVLRDQQVPVVEQHVMAEADGILGVAALSDKQLTVDFRNNRVSLGYSQRLPPYLITVKAKRLRTGLLVTPAMVGQVRALAIIDTGAQRTLGNRALQRALRQQHGAVTDISIYGTTSSIVAAQQVVIRNISLGDVRVNNSQVAFGDFHVFDVWDLNDQPALILGMDVIGRVDVFVIDFRRLEIGFRS